MNRIEESFKNWLDSNEYPYIYIDQSVDTFSNFFRGFTKRPDFLVVVRNFGIIAVDVKYRGGYEKYKSFILDESEEIEKYLEFERIVRIPVWFVFKKDDQRVWYWIPLSKVLSIEPKKSKRSGERFRPIREEDCIIIQEGRDTLSRLVE